LSFFVLQKIDFLTPNCPEAAKKGGIWGLKKTQKRFFNG
jgi:hypothetical protein